VRQGLIDTIEALRKTGCKIWIMRQVPRSNWDVPRALALNALRGGESAALDRPIAEHRAADAGAEIAFSGLEEKFQNVEVLDPIVYFDNGMGGLRIAADGKALYRDDNHLTIAGAMRIKPLFEPIFAEIATTHQ
jgi:hypothetical protein